MLRSIYVFTAFHVLACGGIVGPSPEGGSTSASTTGGGKNGAYGPTPTQTGDDDEREDTDSGAAVMPGMPVTPVAPTVVNPGQCIDLSTLGARAVGTRDDLLAALDGAWASCVATTDLVLVDDAIGIDFLDGIVKFLFSDGDDGFAFRSGAADVRNLSVDPEGADGTWTLELAPSGGPPTSYRVSLFDDPNHLRLTKVATGKHADFVVVGEGLH